MTEPHTPPKGRVRALWRRYAIDTTPLRGSRDFRLLWTGNSISSMGSSVAIVCLPFQVYELTGSAFKSGLLGAAELVPLLVCSLVGGSIADASERRKLMLTILAVATAASGFLSFHSAGEEQLWVLYLMAAVQAGVWGFMIPARRSWTPRLVREDQLAAAAALDSATMTFAHFAGPMVGGVAIATIGLAATYLIDAITFAVAFVAVFMMNPSPPNESSPTAGVRSIKEGLQFLRGRKVLQGGFWIDFNAMVFGMPTVLFPAIAESLGGGSKTVGLLYAAPFVGAFVATMTSGWIGRVGRQGMGVTICVIGWGLSIAAFGAVNSLWLALPLLAMAGFFDDISAILRTAIVQEVTPDHLRGRLSGMEIAVYASGPTLGHLEAGVVAGLTSVRTSVVSGGLMCLVGAAAVALLLPQFNRYDRTKKTLDAPVPTA